jgi:hypothetical protein
MSLDELSGSGFEAGYDTRACGHESLLVSDTPANRSVLARDALSAAIEDVDTLSIDLPLGAVAQHTLDHRGPGMTTAISAANECIATSSRRASRL